ncbi:hypothetical protein ASD04_00475 [Devosia sp. Root436]|uniref:oligosaccharide flippase family protein n=1 Tax=Devosia sp. Root436 TaxID=1736537 RepID=UPI0006F32CA6|nr:oligosaccharide flippase family protein [Devosia sp. Root436]KQX42484.1 hypothetical protein ASD04_00475 [Devosia sp. Root436]
MQLSQKINNLALLVGGYLAGQGGLFLSQSWLLANEQVSLLAAFGLCFSVAGLFAILVDFGFITVLARHVAVSGETPHSIYWVAVATRMLPVLATVFAAVAWICWPGSSPFSRSYALFALPGVVAWSFNLTGILDGLRLSGVNGIAAAMPFLLSAAALIVAGDVDPTIAGALLGAALSLGYFGGLVLQVCVLLRRHKRYLVFSSPTFREIADLAPSAVKALLTTLPGQVYFRAQLAICAWLLGDNAVALLIYCKQIVTAFLLMASFLRRVEFPDLAQALAGATAAPLRVVYRMQLGGTLFGLFGFVGVLMASLVANQVLSGPLTEAARYLSLFSILIFSGAVSSATVQGLLATARFGAAALASAIASVAGVGLSLATVAWLGIVGFVLADLVGNVASGIVSSIMIARSSTTGRESKE